MYAVEVKNMGQKMESNFKKRFGDRFEIVYADKPLRPAEREMQNIKICRALISVISGILGREPTQSELLGIDDISLNKKRDRK
jgi:hypothetical protein